MDGKVIVNDLTVVGWGVTYADDRILVNPLSWGKAKIEVASAKFYNPKFPQGRENDMLSTLIALGSVDEVNIF